MLIESELTLAPQRRLMDMLRGKTEEAETPPLPTHLAPQVLAGFCLGHRWDAEQLYRPKAGVTPEIVSLARPVGIMGMEAYPEEVRRLRSIANAAGFGVFRTRAHVVVVDDNNTFVPPDEAVRWRYHEARLDVDVSATRLPELFWLGNGDTYMIGRDLLLEPDRSGLARWSIFYRSVEQDPTNALLECMAFAELAASNVDVRRKRITRVLTDTDPQVDDGWAMRSPGDTGA